MSLSQKIKELRKEKNLTQEGLGDLLSVDKSQISKYEKGINVPPLDKLEKMAEIFGVKISELVEDESLLKLNNESIMNAFPQGLRKGPISPITNDQMVINKLLNEIEILKKENEGLGKENKLLREMVELLKAKK